MSTISECLATPHEFAHKGKTYSVSLITQNVKAAFEKRLFGRAREAASAMRDLMSTEDYRQHLKALNDDYIAGQNAFESERGIKAVQTINGMVSLCSLLFDIDEQEMLKIIVERKEEVTSLVNLIFKESFPLDEQPSQS